MRRQFLQFLAITSVLAACNSGSAQPAPLAATTTAAPVATTRPGVTSTSAAGSTTAPSTTGVLETATLPPGGVELPAGGAWAKVASAPGVTTPGLVYQLMPKLWVYLPVKEDISQGITWVLTAKDLPVIEAYLRAELVYYSSIAEKPMAFAADQWHATFLDGGGALLTDLRRRLSLGEYADISGGVVLRPQVIGDERSDSSAIVFDCLLDGGVFRSANGSLAEGSKVGVGPAGASARVVRKGAKWLVSQLGSQPDACS